MRGSAAVGEVPGCLGSPGGSISFLRRLVGPGHFSCRSSGLRLTSPSLTALGISKVGGWPTPIIITPVAKRVCPWHSARCFLGALDLCMASPIDSHGLVLPHSLPTK